MGKRRVVLLPKRGECKAARSRLPSRDEMGLGGLGTINRRARIRREIDPPGSEVIPSELPHLPRRRLDFI